MLKTSKAFYLGGRLTTLKTVDLKKDNRNKLIQNMMQMNNNIDPRFKLAQVDLEHYTRILPIGQWSKPVSKEFLIKAKKEQRRKDYWNSRVLPPDSGIGHGF